MIEKLKLHQAWRLGEIDEQPLTAKETTQCIDWAISRIEILEGLAERGSGGGTGPQGYAGDASKLLRQ